MFKLVVLVACVASAHAGFLHGGVTSYAAGPALGAPLLGKVTYNAPETTIVKQPVVVDQQEIRYRSVPTVIQTAPVVKHIQPVIEQTQVVAAAPAVTYSALPAAGVAYSGLTYSGLGAINTIGAPALTYSGLGINTIGAPAWNLGAPAVTLLKK